MFSIGSGAARADIGHAATVFRNPIARGADPWVIQHGGYYYWCLSEGDRGVAVHRSRSLTTLGDKFIVWEAPGRGPYSAQVWAPELHRLDGRWYIYVAASNGHNETHRMIALESPGDDPTQRFAFKAEFYTGDDPSMQRRNRWAIDGTVLAHAGQRYFLWSGWADERDEQCLYLAPMANPWTLAAKRVRLCANDDFAWERVGESPSERGLNEGPQVLQHNGRTFVVYSCSGSWEPSYKLGRLELEGDPLDPRAWRKHADPVFRPTVTTCGVGHCSFTQSPDGTEDWIVYHAKVSAAPGWDRRIHAQQFRWDDAGRPVFGPVLGATRPQARPSGEQTTVKPRWPGARELIGRITVANQADESDRTAVGAKG